LVEIREIEELIELMQRSGVSELSIEKPDYKVSIKRSPESGGRSAPGAPEGGAEPAAEEPLANVTITAEVVPVVSPVVGVFHNGGTSEPREPVRAGDRVEENQLLAVIEAMKVPHEVRAAVAGVIAEAPVEEGAAVEYGQRLFLIQPEEEGEASDEESTIGLA